MKLLINAKWRTQRHMSGVQRYAEGLSKAIEGADLDAYWTQPKLGSRLAGIIWEQRTLPRIARSYDALLCPGNMAPSHLHPDTRLMVIVHCLRYRMHPESYSKSFVRWYERMIPRIIHRADHVFTVSECQRTEIEAEYPESFGKISVLRPGLDAAFNPRVTRDPEQPASPYVVAVTSAAPAKNLAMLIRAYADAPQLPQLLLIGVTPTEADVLCPESVRSRVRAMGHICDPDRVASLVAHADLLLAPSRYESFGLPCLEAMGCATPVIASDIPAHREVCAQAARYAHPDDESAWRSVMLELSEDRSMREKLAEAGFERSRQFDWSDTVGELRDVLRGLEVRIGG
ncbi:MAG: glycosyltransferase family 4 protein [Phycisphaerales bacterium]